MGSSQVLNGLRECSNVLLCNQLGGGAASSPHLGGTRAEVTPVQGWWVHRGSQDSLWSGGMVSEGCEGPAWVSLSPSNTVSQHPTRGHPPSAGTQRAVWRGCAKHRHLHPAWGPQLRPLKTSLSPLPGLQRRAWAGRDRQERRQRGCVSRGKGSHVSDELRERLGNEHQHTDRREETGM